MLVLCGVLSDSVNMNKGTHKNVWLLQELWWNFQALEGCSFLSFQGPLEFYPWENQMVGSSPLCHFQSQPEGLIEHLWPSRVL